MTYKLGNKYSRCWCALAGPHAEATGQLRLPSSGLTPTQDRFSSLPRVPAAWGPERYLLSKLNSSLVTYG